MAAYQPWAVSFVALTLFSVVSGRLLTALVTASASCVLAGFAAVLPITRSKLASSDWVAEAVNSAWSAACCCWACSRVVSAAGVRLGGEELSATNKVPRCSDSWFSTRSSAPSAVALPFRSASLVPLPAEALNVLAAWMAWPANN
jgi:hypothetical protein